MTRVWYNKAFSSVATAIRLIREADASGTYEIYCTNSNTHSPAVRTAHHFSVEPSGLSEAAYVDWCLEFCRQQQIDIFIPGKAAGAIAGQHPRFLAAGTRVLSVASSDVLALLRDKAAFYQAVELPLTPPADFRVVRTIEQYDVAYAQLRALYPQLCIKPATSVFGIGFSVIDEQRSTTQLLLDGVEYHVNATALRDGLAAMAEFRPLLLMEYLPGHEYSVDCVADFGRLVCSVPRKKSLVQGHGQTIELHPDIVESVRQLAHSYQLNGVFNVQFREGLRGLGLLEINPRMSGGIGMACLAGPNLPYCGLVGFDKGYAGLELPAVREGLHVSEMAVAVEVQ